MIMLILNAERRIDLEKDWIGVSCLLIVCGSYGTLYDSVSRPGLHYWGTFQTFHFWSRVVFLLRGDISTSKDS